MMHTNVINITVNLNMRFLVVPAMQCIILLNKYTILEVQFKNM